MKDTFFEYLDIIQVFFQNIIDKMMNYDYIDSITEFFTNLHTIDFMKWALVYFFILWVAIIIWVTRDILSRSSSIILQFLSILLVVFLTPILGLPVYFMIRPSHKKYDEDDYEEVYEEVEIDEDEQNNKSKEEVIKEKVEKEELVASFEKIMCYNCHYHIEEDFRFCPNCEIQLLDNCKRCSKQVKTNWKICPYCWDKIEEEVKEEEKNTEEKKKSFFSNLFSSEKKEIENKKTVKIKVEKKESKLDEKDQKVLEVENIKKEIEKTDSTKNLEKDVEIEKKEVTKNINIRKSRKQRRLEKRMKKN